ncbi:MAG: hypothetical protein U1E02_13170, partial [Hydrogenophaga sp.]|nr:hypothetical protein [Hydrogenophaga sp.]
NGIRTHSRAFGDIRGHHCLARDLSTVRALSLSVKNCIHSCLALKLTDNDKMLELWLPKVYHY